MSSFGDTARRRAPRARRPSSAGYTMAAIGAAICVFFGLWWLLVIGGDETPWISAGLAAGLLLLVALSAREVVMRRAWTRYLLEHGVQENASRTTSDSTEGSKKTYSTSRHSSALKAIQTQAAEADASSIPERHLEVFRLCQNYLASTDESLRSSSLTAEKRNSIRSGQERARALEKHHLLTWARDSSRTFTHEAQRRARTSDKIETANRALDCLDSALKVFPAEPELNASKLAIREFIASVKVAHWVELAERAAFKGHYRRAIDRYKDALFYLGRDSAKDDVRSAGAERIGHEIELLLARLKSSSKASDDSVGGRSSEMGNGVK